MLCNWRESINFARDAFCQKTCFPLWLFIANCREVSYMCQWVSFWICYSRSWCPFKNYLVKTIRKKKNLVSTLAKRVELPVIKYSRSLCGYIKIKFHNIKLVHDGKFHFKFLYHLLLKSQPWVFPLQFLLSLVWLMHRHKLLKVLLRVGYWKGSRRTLALLEWESGICW